MKIVSANSQNKQQEKAIKAVFKALNVPYEEEPVIDETAYLLSSKTNKKRLIQAINPKNTVNGVSVKVEDLWK